MGERLFLYVFLLQGFQLCSGFIDVRALTVLVGEDLIEETLIVVGIVLKLGPLHINGSFEVVNDLGAGFDLTLQLRNPSFHGGKLVRFGLGLGGRAYCSRSYFRFSTRT